MIGEKRPTGRLLKMDVQCLDGTIHTVVSSRWLWLLHRRVDRAVLRANLLGSSDAWDCHGGPHEQIGHYRDEYAENPCAINYTAPAVAGGDGGPVDDGGA